ncbi:MAG: protein kinase [Archangium sp.]|nr:protein kinase [Archangium sp.]
MSDDHPSSIILAKHLGRILRPEESRLVESHLERCVLCRAELSTLKEMNLAATQHAGSTGSPQVEPPEPGLEDTLIKDRSKGHSAATDPEGHPPFVPPTTSREEIAEGTPVGRYVITRRIGAGAMGDVYSARDPRLDRQVAIKLLRDDLPMVENKSLRQRLEREAQALARLSHPNVVGVHDLGEWKGNLFIAMDLIEGQTLTQWMETHHSRGSGAWGEVQRIFLMAGEGLAAAHRAGLVHRDVKPDNILVGTDGIARMSDFGVSRRVSEGGSSGDDTITGAGSLIGTPAYMSPEQFDGKSTDQRSDQFGFCVTLFEALSGQKPFLGSTLKLLSEAVHAGPPERIPSRTSLPAWLEAVVLRGLSTKPDDRFTSMDELLVALRGPAPERRSPWGAVAVAVVALLIAAGLGWLEWLRRRDDPCLHVEERVTRAWDDSSRARVTSGVKATGVAWSDDSALRIDTEFRRFLFKWSEDYLAVCAELKQAPPDDRALLTARQVCLEERFNAFEVIRNLFEKPTPDTLREGQAHLSQVLGGNGCGAQSWYFEVPGEARRRSDFDRLHKALIALEAEVNLSLPGQPASPIGDAGAVDARSAGNHLERLAELKREAGALGFAQLVAAARLQEARVLEKRATAREAEAAYEEAAVLGEAAKNDAVVASARTLEVLMIAGELDIKRAREKVAPMRAAWQRLGLDPDQHRPALGAEATVLRKEGRYPESLEKLRKMLKMYGPDDEAMRCEILRELGSTLVEATQFEEGIATSQQATDCLRRLFGNAHPLVASSLMSNGVMLSKVARETEAQAAIEEALTILEKDPDQREYMLALFNRGLTLKRQKRLAEARPLIEKALAIAEARNDETRLVPMLSGLAETLQELNELDAALEATKRSVAIGTRLYGDGPQMSATLTVTGSIYESMGRHEQAAEVLRRALVTLEHPSASPVLREVTRYELARSLWHQSATRKESIELVKSVRAYFVSRGPNFKDYVAEADEWLAKHK